MARFGTVSYNIYCNFTNYGSALQTWALHQAIRKLGHEPVLVDYCPDVLAHKDPLEPYAGMWDQDDEARREVEASMPAIRVNYAKFDRFYRERFSRTSRKYTSENFGDISDEGLDGFVCGSDTIFCPDEFGFDDGYYANYPAMRRRSVSYAASFGDPHFGAEGYRALDARIGNFLALGIREGAMVPYLRERTSAPVRRTIDPTLLLTADEYGSIVSPRAVPEDYLLLYSRRRAPRMEAYAERLARGRGWRIVEISLRASNASLGHEMAYAAGVEEFLSLVRSARHVVTNSYHGMVFSVQFRRPFSVFSREQCDGKIGELLSILGAEGRMLATGDEGLAELDYGSVHERIAEARAESLEFLGEELGILEGAAMPWQGRKGKAR